LKILIDIGHPAHVHFFKNTIFALEEKGHEIMVTSRDKEVVIDLLDYYNIEHVVLSSMGSGKINLIKEWIIRDFKLLKIAKKFNPDIITGILMPNVAHVAWLLKKKSIIFNDTEHAAFAQKITYPFTNVICTPSCFEKTIKTKQLTYEGYHELAYLHPNYFIPNPSVLKEVGLTENDRFTIIRFVSWGAHHDVGHHGIHNRTELIKELENYGQIIITSENELEPELEKYKLKVSPEKLHDLLYYATLYIGEGSTTASECAILGTHAIYINTLKLGYTNEQESKYDLVYNFSDENGVFEKAIELLKNPNLWNEGKIKREKLLADKVDVTDYMVKTIEDCPDIS
jgi:predicted glycosyltransferase